MTAAPVEQEQELHDVWYGGSREIARRGQDRLNALSCSYTYLQYCNQSGRTRTACTAVLTVSMQWHPVCPAWTGGLAPLGPLQDQGLDLWWPVLLLLCFCRAAARSTGRLSRFALSAFHPICLLVWWVLLLYYCSTVRVVLLNHGSVILPLAASRCHLLTYSTRRALRSCSIIFASHDPAPLP